MPRSAPVAFVAFIAVVSQLFAGCGDTEDRDLCAQYADLVTTVEELQGQDPLAAEAEELQTAAAELEAELDQFQAVAEGRLDTAISTLRAAVDAIRQAAIANGGAALETARPFLEDAMEQVDEAWTVLEALAEVQCDAS
jgi:ABC-type amino acid transport substrate-binding protein